MVDTKECQVFEFNKSLLKLLLFDHSTMQNIKWATESYLCYGADYSQESQIQIEQITGKNINIVQPRIEKTLEAQTKRTRENAEVFTPSWICNEQNNLIDEQWFGKKNVFNIARKESWTTVSTPIKFPDNHTWKEYVDSKRIEITCGEAPYLVSRYDTVTGRKIPVEDRIGLLDRKLRIVNENTFNFEDWYKWTIRAYQSIYGYEYQGDNVLIARKNLLYVFAENMVYKFGYGPNLAQLKKIANIISWNIWQMDGITMMAPYSKQEKKEEQMLLVFSNTCNTPAAEPIPCRIKNWRSKCTVNFKDLGKKG